MRVCIYIYIYTASFIRYIYIYRERFIYIYIFKQTGIKRRRGVNPRFWSAVKAAAIPHLPATFGGMTWDRCNSSGGGGGGSSSSSTQRFGLWPMGKTHISNKHVQIHWKTQYDWQVLFPKATHKITTNMKHQNQQTFEDKNENALLTKSSAESVSIFQTKGSKTFGKKLKIKMFKLGWLIWKSKKTQKKN